MAVIAQIGCKAAATEQAGLMMWEVALVKAIAAQAELRAADALAMKHHALIAIVYIPENAVDVIIRFRKAVQEVSVLTLLS
ncbi:MAG: hypothetical protein IPN27_11655 [Cellvibrionales bacterium]|nr:hypothetical protein [Cellvibrionales bacterium]